MTLLAINYDPNELELWIYNSEGSFIFHPKNKIPHLKLYLDGNFENSFPKFLDMVKDAITQKSLILRDR